MSRGRVRFSEMSTAELQAYENSQSYLTGRRDAFDHGNSETILEYWSTGEPTHNELLTIVKNLLSRSR